MSRTLLQFTDAPLEALQSNHRMFAISAGLAMKYPRDVAPFAAVLKRSRQAWLDLLELLEPGEASWVVGEEAAGFEGLRCDRPVGVLQMTYPAERELPVVAAGVTMEALSCADAEEMVALTSIAFPGFFRRRTCEMGSYYGIREGGRLVAMCGERMAIGEFREISGLCTHPEARGRGYAPMLIGQLMRDHRAAGLRSYLHVSAENPAAALYVRMGFEPRGKFGMQRFTRI